MNVSVQKAPRWLQDHGDRILAAGAVLSLLYFGRHVLIPVALALMISLLLAPAVRALRRTEVGHAPSVLIAALMLAVACLTMTVAIGAQVLCIAESIPQYEATIHSKLKTLDESTLGKVRALTSEASDLVTIQDPATSSSPERKRSEALHQQVQELLPRAQVVSLSCPGVTASPDEESADASALPTADSLEQALRFVSRGGRCTPGVIR